jgi:hypothetical protein
MPPFSLELVGQPPIGTSAEPSTPTPTHALATSTQSLWVALPADQLVAGGHRALGHVDEAGLAADVILVEGAVPDLLDELAAGRGRQVVDGVVGDAAVDVDAAVVVVAGVQLVHVRRLVAARRVDEAARVALGEHLRVTISSPISQSSRSTITPSRRRSSR